MSPSTERISDLVVVGKPPASNLTTLELWSRFIADQVERGAALLIDYSDNHLIRDGNRPIAEFYRSLLKFSPWISCPTEALRKSLIESDLSAANRTYVIRDWNEFEGLSFTPFERPEDGPVGIWFGHGSNLGYLLSKLRERGGTLSGVRLMVVSSVQALVHMGFKGSHWAKNLDNWLYPIPWTKENLGRALTSADYAVIPSDRQDPKKQHASPNRLITSLHYGLPIVATVLESYQPYSKFFVDIESPVAKDLIKNPRGFRQMAEGFFECHGQSYSIGRIREDWQALLEALLNKPGT